MRFLATLAAATLMTGAVAQAGTITDDRALLDLFQGDLYLESTAPLSADYAVDQVHMTGGLGFSPLWALELMDGTDRVLLAETSDWSLEGGNVLSFLFDLDDGSSFGDWLKVTLTFAGMIASPLDQANNATYDARMSITTGPDLAPVPVPAALPMLLSGLVAAGAFVRRRQA